MSDQSRDVTEFSRTLQDMPAIPDPLQLAYLTHADKIDELAPLVTVHDQDRLVVRPYYALHGVKHANSFLALRAPVLQRLNKAAGLLPPGFRLLLLDAWRSGEAQRAIFEYFCRVAKELGEDPGKFAFDLDGDRDRDFPTDDAPHRTGGAVDVTLLAPDGIEWPMGTDFDAISSLSATRAFESDNMDEIAKLGRRTLFHVMTSAGFTNYPEEWWHYDYGNAFWRHYGKCNNNSIFRTVELYRDVLKS